MQPHAALLVSLLALAAGLMGYRPDDGVRITAAGPEAVLLVHGLARTGRSMEPLARHLRTRGYTVAVLDYPSRTAPVATLSTAHLEPAFAACRQAGARRIHVVTHSLGGVLIRELASREPIPGLGRVVMLAPPGSGSEVVDEIGHWRLFAWLNGPAGRELGTGPESTPNRLPPAAFDCGVIAGHRSINLINSLAMIPGPDDGKVAVARCAVDGMTDSVVLPVTHPMIMRDRRVWAQIDSFIRSGAFDHGTAPSIDGYLAVRGGTAPP